MSLDSDFSPESYWSSVDPDALLDDLLTLTREAAHAAGEPPARFRSADLGAHLRAMMSGGAGFALSAEDAAFAQAQPREVGDVWQGPSGRWFTRRQDGRVVPARAVGTAEPAPKAPAAEKPKAPTIDEAVGHIRQVQAQGVTAESLAALGNRLATMRRDDLREVNRRLGLGAGGARTKEALARGVAERGTKPGKADVGEITAEEFGGAPPPASAAPSEEEWIRSLPPVEAAPAEPWRLPEGYKPPNPHARSNAGLPDQSRPALTLREAKAVEQYTTPSRGYDQLNAALRRGGEPEGQAKEIHEGLREAFARARVFDAPVRVDRGVDLYGKELDDFLGRFRRAKAAGEPVRLAGYQSTSTELGRSGEYGDMKVRVSILARRGLDAAPYSFVPAERELVLDHDEAYRVHSVRQAAGGQWHVKLEQLV